MASNSCWITGIVLPFRHPLGSEIYIWRCGNHWWLWHPCLLIWQEILHRDTPNTTCVACSCSLRICLLVCLHIWTASLSQWTWVWAGSGSWWWTGKPGMLQSMGCKESDKTERLNWTYVFSVDLWELSSMFPVNVLQSPHWFIFILLYLWVLFAVQIFNLIYPFINFSSIFFLQNKFISQWIRNNKYFPLMLLKCALKILYNINKGFDGLPGSSEGNLPAMQETQIWSLGWEKPLEKGMATHSSFLAWRIPWTEGPGRLSSMELQRVERD